MGLLRNLLRGWRDLADCESDYSHGPIISHIVEVEAPTRDGTVRRRLEHSHDTCGTCGKRWHRFYGRAR